MLKQFVGNTLTMEEESNKHTDDVSSYLRKLLRSRARVRCQHESSRRSALSYSALLGVSVLATVQIISLPELSTSLMLSTVCFAVAIPFLTSTVYTDISVRKEDGKYEPTGGWALLTDPLGILASWFGLTEIFIHLWWLAGMLFTLASITALAVYLQSIWTMAKANAEVQD